MRIRNNYEIMNMHGNFVCLQFYDLKRKSNILYQIKIEKPLKPIYKLNPTLVNRFIKIAYPIAYPLTYNLYNKYITHVSDLYMIYIY